MTTESIVSALQRVRAVFARRPEAALHADKPATAHWQQGLRVVCHDADGPRIVTDMPREIGGQGDEVTPGWLLRAALASCLASRIAMEAAARDISIARLEVTAASESDARGIFGIPDAAGERVPAGPRCVQMRVRVAAKGASTETLRAVIEESHRCSPVECAVEQSVPVRLEIDIEPA
jgi:uncharacterized OsmC-like protein